MKTALPVTAIWLRRIGDHVEVLVESDGHGWRRAIRELAEGSYSHIAESNGAYRWPDMVYELGEWQEVEMDGDWKSRPDGGPA